MDQFTLLKEQLRRFTWIGDTDGIQELINFGIDVNAKYEANGWTALHLACKKNNLETVKFLLKNGADKNIKSYKGETPASLSTNSSILKLLDSAPDVFKITNDQEAPNFVPKFTKNTSMNCKAEEFPQQSFYKESQGEIVLKLRIADANDSDFIEVDIPRNNLTYPNLINICCEELEINAAQVAKLRKLPNTRIRRNKDVQRLENFQEIEVVLYSSTETNDLTQHKPIEYRNGSTVPITPTNNYQSISKKDQTILY